VPDTSNAKEATGAAAITLSEKIPNLFDLAHIDRQDRMDVSKFGNAIIE
jgi:hypothetical protein